ncbi:hypothetical protein DXG01_008849 [Tephrocybe rancida]|nr:hypothetical protein DXG01_008849 [Tephrocybe rancida]
MSVPTWRLPTASAWRTSQDKKQDKYRRRVSKLAKTKIQPHTPNQDATLSEQRNSLRNKMRNWEQLRPIYMPGLLKFLTEWLRAELPATDAPLWSDKPEKASLWLPSQLPPEQRLGICSPGLPGMEAKLRVAQCHDALEGL